MSNNTILYALYRMGHHSGMTGHCFSGLASTIFHKQDWNHAWIELQLADADSNQVSAAYNAAQSVAGRTKMMQSWAPSIVHSGQPVAIKRCPSSYQRNAA